MRSKDVIVRSEISPIKMSRSCIPQRAIPCLSTVFTGSGQMLEESARDSALRQQDRKQIFMYLPAVSWKIWMNTQH